MLPQAGVRLRPRRLWQDLCACRPIRGAQALAHGREAVRLRLRGLHASAGGAPRDPSAGPSAGAGMPWRATVIGRSIVPGAAPKTSGVVVTYRSRYERRSPSIEPWSAGAVMGGKSTGNGVRVASTNGTGMEPVAEQGAPGATGSSGGGTSRPSARHTRSSPAHSVEQRAEKWPGLYTIRMGSREAHSSGRSRHGK